jgi:hypothetical protein
MLSFDDKIKEHFQLLKEKEEQVIFETKFIKAVEDYVFKNESKYLNYVIKSKSKIHKQFLKSGTYYRGMILDEKSYELLQNNKLKFNDISSWSTDLKIAKNFVTSSKFITKGKKGKKVILKKKISSKDVILNIYDYVLFMYSSGKLDDFDEVTLDSALKEKETIINKIDINKKDLFEEIK